MDVSLQGCSSTVRDSFTMHSSAPTPSINVGKRSERAADQAPALIMEGRGHDRKHGTLGGIVEEQKKALSWAVEYGQKDIVEQFFGWATFDPNQKDREGQTALMLAARHSQTAIFRLLFESPRVDINCVDSREKTALLTAAEHGATEIVDFLLGSTKIDDADRRDVYGQTPLFYAAKGGHEAVVKRLLDSGKVDINSDNGTPGSTSTPLAVATKRSHFGTAKLLQERGGVVCQEVTKQSQYPAEDSDSRSDTGTDSDTGSDDSDHDSDLNSSERGDDDW
ncbi:ankyrin repeat-containing domain protein [Chaetomium sp. MPI-CAGE-AT-0009]|nr:ankyrin repeat-containing domain protein [Chaetomium sp. MPI-CAGE-AT-0009]